MKKLFIYALLLGSAIVNAADYWPASCLQSISIGQTINGQISTSSDCYEISSDANKMWYTDVYTFNGTAGQKIAITMNGVGDFDPDLSLYLGNSYDNNIDYNDDGGGGVNARIPADTGYITLASTQTYFIWASTPYRNTGGSYTLTLSSDSASAAAEVIEFFHSSLDHYFITASASEAAVIDSGGAGAGWVRTGNTFKSGGSTPVCRFYGSLSPGPNSHFYTLAGTECDALKQLQATTPATQKRWNFESLDFVSTPTTNGNCSSETVPVFRAYNNGFSRSIDSNHRITRSQTGIQEVVARGWTNEGVVMCAPPGGSDQPTGGGSATGKFTYNTGGTVSTTGGQKLEVPPGAVPKNASGQVVEVTFSAETVSTPPKPLPTGVSALGQVTKFGPDAFSFAWPLSTSLPIPTSATSLSNLKYMRYVPATSGWVSYPGFALATDASNRVIAASVATYDLGYDTLAMQAASPTASALDRFVPYLEAAPTKFDRWFNANGLKTAVAPSADRPETSPDTECTTCSGAMRWDSQNCDNSSGAECHYYFVAKNYKPRTSWQKDEFTMFLTYWYNRGNGCAWNAGTERFEAVADGNCGTFRTGSEPTGDPAPSTLFNISQGDWEFCTTKSQYVIPGGSLPLPGKWTYSTLVPVSITQASHNTCQVFSCWSNVVGITMPSGGEWKEPAQMTSCPASTTVTIPVGTGDFQATLSWVNTAQANADIDLHLYGPNNIHISYQVKKSTDGSLQLDRDWTSDLGNAVENIYSTGTAPMPSGEYRLTVLFFNDYGYGPMSYNVRTIHAGTAKTYSGTLTTKKQEVEIERFSK